MSKLIYGRNQQIKFNNEEEKKEAIDYILNSKNVDFNVHENNQNQGAWGPEDRIHFFNEDDIPKCLKRQLTAGRGDGIYGRINCKEFCEEIRQIAKNKK